MLGSRFSFGDISWLACLKIENSFVNNVSECIFSYFFPWASFYCFDLIEGNHGNYFIYSKKAENHFEQYIIFPLATKDVKNILEEEFFYIHVIQCWMAFDIWRTLISPQISSKKKKQIYTVMYPRPQRGRIVNKKALYWNWEKSNSRACVTFMCLCSNLRHYVLITTSSPFIMQVQGWFNIISQ